MPVYQYLCKNCAELLEIQQSFSDDPLTTCPKCSGELRKQFGAVGVVFKGAGFYATDSRGSSSAVSTEKPISKPDKSADKS